MKVNDAGEVTFDIASSEKYQVWLDDQLAESKTHIEANLQPGIHKLTFRIEISEQNTPTLKVDVSKTGNSTAQFEVIGGA